MENPSGPSPREVAALVSSTPAQRRKYILNALTSERSLVRIGHETTSLQGESVGGRLFVPLWPHEVFVGYWNKDMLEDAFADKDNAIRRVGYDELVYELFPRYARARVAVGLFPIDREYAEIVDAWDLATEIRQM